MEFDGFKKNEVDNWIEGKLAHHLHTHNIEPLDAVKLFPVLARRQWLKRFLSHVELFKQTLDVPGDIVELGVFRGLGLMTWANLLECYCIGNRTKIVYGFDNFSGIKKLSIEDGREYGYVQKYKGGFSPERYYEEIKDAIAIFDEDRFIKWKDRVKLVVGNIDQTIPHFINDNPGIRFSLIHFDCDMYEPTKVALECLYPLLSVGGIALFDEYAIHEWAGETKAVDEYFKGKVKIRTLSWTNAPAGYIVKEG